MAQFEIREGNTSIEELHDDASAEHTIINQTRSPLVIVAAEYVTATNGAVKLTVIEGSELQVNAGGSIAVDYSAYTNAVGIFQLSPSEIVNNTFDFVTVTDTTPRAKSKSKAKTEGE